MQGHVVDVDKATELEVTAVCIFKDPKTYMQLESATHGPDGNSTVHDFAVVDERQLSRQISVKEYGNERIFMSHKKGLGSESISYTVHNHRFDLTCLQLTNLFVSL